MPDQQGLLARPAPHGQSRPHLLPAPLLAGASRGPRPRQAACGELSGATSGTPRPGRFGGWRQSCAISDTRPLPHLRPLEVTEGQEEGASLPPSGWIEQDFSRNAATIARGRRFRTQAARPPVKGTPHLPKTGTSPFPRSGAPHPPRKSDHGSWRPACHGRLKGLRELKSPRTVRELSDGRWAALVPGGLRDWAEVG